MKHQSFLPWVEKYRPETLDELVSVEHIVNSLKSFMEKGSFPNLLFYGPPGSGKTSTALALLNSLYKGRIHKSMFLELNASDDRGISIVREEIITFSSTTPLFGSGFKFIILDEADAMTNDSQNALRRVVEKYSKNVRFCFICNYLNGIIPAIQSRCTRFRFSPLSSDKMLIKLQQVIIKESIEVTEKGIETILRLAKGDMRKCLNILQGTFLSSGSKIDDNSIYLTTGHPSEENMLKICNLLLGDNSIKNIFEEIWNVKQDKGIALSDMLHELHYMFSIKNYKLDNKQISLVIKKFAELERLLSESSIIGEKVHLLTIISLFKHVKSVF